jgi:hypothetical protein
MLSVFALPFVLAQQIAVPAPDIATNVTAAFLAVRLLEAAKRSKRFAFLGEFTPIANRTASIVLALVAAIGVNYTITSGPAPGDYIIQISGLTWGAVVAAAFAWLKQFIAQEIVYRTTVNQPTP